MSMPMIDVYAADDLFPSGSDRKLGEQLTLAVLRAEGVAKPAAFHLDNTAAFIHLMDAAAVQTAARGNARVVRVQIVTPPGALTRNGQKQLVGDVTRIVADVCGDRRSSRSRTVAPSSSVTRNGSPLER